MESNFDIAIKNFESQLLQALEDNNKKAVINLYGNLCVLEYRTISSKDPEVRNVAFKAQSIKIKALYYLML